ncbi:endonuclease domain-containing protein [Sphingomonas sp. PAMC 26605]|uniref:endonuclease domain-containing protein n=1 Tax=Sphingomonas sp. PAMC 26605 TaxID=1112214 RepID=UPI00026CD6BB|nr:endonuclease domain-containing protein [Sphingomonas sp. PAMC 26605]
MPQTDKQLLARAKHMRSNPTPPEARLWYNLRAKRFEAVKFNHQVVIYPYIADFVARARKLVIELDGDSHADDGAYDARRTVWLEQQGYRVIRFTNADVMGNLDGVLEAISVALGTAPLPDPLPEGEREKEKT